METDTQQVPGDETRNAEERARETGGSEQQQHQDQGATYTQADLDRAITKAISTREQKLRSELDQQKSELEKKQLVEQEKYRELYEQAESERRQYQLQQETASTLSEMNLPNLLPVFSQDHGSIEGRVETAKTIKALIDAEVDRRVADRIKTPPAPRGQAAAPKSVNQMTPDEYRDWKKSNRIF